MPNHVTVKVKPLCEKEKFNEILSKITTDNSIDFQKIIPLDKDFENFQPDTDVVDRAKMALGIGKNDFFNRASNPVRKDVISEIIKAMQLYQKTGYCYWYDAQSEEWDTKWNAYETKVNNDSFEFQTAWSLPTKVLIKLSQMYQDIVFDINYADEDLGSNCGHLKILNSEIIESEISDWHKNSKEERRKWIKFAFNLQYPNSNPLDYGYDEHFNYID